MKKVFIMMMTALMFLALAACNKGISTNTETSATIGVTTAEIPSVYYEEMEYHYVGEYLGCEVYELTDYVTEPMPMRTPLYEGEDILYYVSGESVLTRYIFIVDNEPLTINEVLDENILTIEQLYGLEFLGIKASDYQVNMELYEAIHDYITYLEDKVALSQVEDLASQGMIRPLGMVFNQSNEIDRNPYQYPSEYEWLWTYQGYFELAEELVLLGYEEGEFIKISEFVSENIPEHYYRDDYIVKLQRDGQSVVATFIRNTDYYEYENSIDSLKVIGQFVDEKLSLKSTNEMISPDGKLLRMYYEDYLESTVMVRVEADYLQDRYGTAYSYGFTINETTDIMTEMFFDENGYVTGNYLMSVYDDKDQILYNAFGSDLGARWLNDDAKLRDISLGELRSDPNRYRELAAYQQHIWSIMDSHYYDELYDINFLDAFDLVDGEMYRVDYELIYDMYMLLYEIDEDVDYFLENQLTYLDCTYEHLELDGLYAELTNYEFYGKTYALIVFNEETQQFEENHTPLNEFMMAKNNGAGYDSQGYLLEQEALSLVTKEDYMEYGKLLNTFQLCYSINPNIIYTAPGKVLQMNENVIRTWMSNPNNKYLIDNFVVNEYQQSLNLNDIELINDLYAYKIQITDRLDEIFTKLETDYSTKTREEFVQYMIDQEYALYIEYN